ncbi:MAG: hypothetical protein BKP49_02575 [Treponema sp. CETP13]|nr:MAG: hypothetical protein BKP49_02575 [Treponema sp. CETP13]
MEKIERVLIAGAGSIGLTVANTILESQKADLRILARGERLERYREKGLYVNGKKLQVKFADADSKKKEDSLTWIPDLIIVACKNHHLITILDDMANFVGKNTLILSLLNGITSEQTIRERYGQERTPLAMIIGTDAGHHGTETTYQNSGSIFFGDATNDTYSKRVQLIADFFDRTGISYTIPQNMKRTLWYKFMCNVGINQSSAILKMPYKPFQQKNSPARNLMLSAMREAMAVSAPEGVNLNEDDITNWLKTLDSISPAGKTSMCQDVCAGRKTEVELFAQTVVELGEKHSIQTPVNKVFYQQLRMLEANYDLL